MLRGVSSTAAANVTPAVTNSTPTTGATVIFTDDSRDRILWLTPAGTLATLTVTLPTNANSRIGQVVRVGATQIITLLTINGATNILRNVTAMAVNDVFSFIKVANDTWARV